MKGKVSKANSTKAKSTVSERITRGLRSLSRQKALDSNKEAEKAKDTVKVVKASASKLAKKETHNTMESKNLRPRRVLVPKTVANTDNLPNSNAVAQKKTKTPKPLLKTLTSFKRKENKLTPKQNIPAQRVPIYKSFIDNEDEVQSQGLDVYDCPISPDLKQNKKKSAKANKKSVKSNKANGNEENKAARQNKNFVSNFLSFNNQRVAEAQAPQIVSPYQNRDIRRVLQMQGGAVIPAAARNFHLSDSLPPLDDFANDMFLDFGVVTSTPDKGPNKRTKKVIPKKKISPKKTTPKKVSEETIYHSIDDSDSEFVSAKEGTPKDGEKYALFSDFAEKRKLPIELELTPMKKPKLDYSNRKLHTRVKPAATTKPVTKNEQKAQVEYEEWAEKMCRHFDEVDDSVLIIE